jgi:hypothetical protein
MSSNVVEHIVQTNVPYARLREGNVFSRLYMESKIRRKNIEIKRHDTYKILDSKMSRKGSTKRIRPEKVELSLLRRSA